MERGAVPGEWKKGLLIKLPKKGYLSYCKNWRGIMLLNMISKVFCRVILERIKTALNKKLREKQAGLRPCRRCTDQIATLFLTAPSPPLIPLVQVRSRTPILTSVRSSIINDTLHTILIVTRFLASVFTNQFYI